MSQSEKSYDAEIDLRVAALNYAEAHDELMKTSIYNPARSQKSLEAAMKLLEAARRFVKADLK